MHGREQRCGQADDEGGPGQGVGRRLHRRIARGAGHHERSRGHEEELADQAAEGAEVRVVEQAVDVGRRFVPGQPRQQPDQRALGDDEAHLAPQREAEPEPRALVAEQLPEEEVPAQAADRVDDPDDPHAEDDGGDVLEDRQGRARAVGAGHHQPGGPEGEVGHERVRERDHERHVAQEQLVTPEAVVEGVAGVRDAGVDGAVLGHAPHCHRHRGVEGGAPPAQVAHGQHHEGDAEERHVPAADERAGDLLAHRAPSPPAAPTLPVSRRAARSARGGPSPPPAPGVAGPAGGPAGRRGRRPAARRRRGARAATPARRRPRWRGS